MNVGDEIREARKRQGMNMKDIAHQLSRPLVNSFREDARGKGICSTLSRL